jgi:hypothetical protein
MCFLVDCTKSMRRYIEEAKTVVKKANRLLKTTFPSFKLRSSFIGYRDYTKKGEDNENRIISFDFSSDIDKFENFVGNIQLLGGGDPCEDVFGGLEAVSKLKWENSSRVLLHICDAPCHGKKYHDDSVKDYFPNGDPKGLMIANILKTIVDLNIDYYFAEISEKTVKMIDEFTKELNLISGTKKLTTYKLNRSTDLLQTISTSVTVTICNSQQMTLHDTSTKVPKNIPVDSSRCKWELTNFEKHSADFYEFKFIGTLDDLCQGKRIDDFIKIQRRENETVFLCPVPFSKGNLRLAYAAMYEKCGEKIKCVAKNSLFNRENKDQYGSNKKNIVLQIIAKFLADEFFKMLSNNWMYEKSIKFLDVNLVQRVDTTEYLTLEEYVNGNFIKWSSNIGYQNWSEYACTLDAFAHWSYVATNGFLIVSDLQGCLLMNTEYVLTDPAISCMEQQFTSTDLGELGILMFFEKHRCNQICRSLKLKKHDCQKESDMPDNEKATKVRKYES